MKYWLFKSEPSTFSINDLAKSPHSTTYWDGVRNYQARNFLRDEIKQGDKVFFYHSNCEPPGIVGIAEVVKEGYPDATAWDVHSDYFDPNSTPTHPRWFRVDIKLIQQFDNLISLDELKKHPLLKNMKVIQRGNRLSITPINEEEWRLILNLQKNRT